jgi:hypothetical protein
VAKKDRAEKAGAWTVLPPRPADEVLTTEPPEPPPPALVRFRFKVSTPFLGSEVSEVVELDLTGFTGYMRDHRIEQEYETWLWNQLETEREELPPGDPAQPGEE